MKRALWIICLACTLSFLITGCNLLNQPQLDTSSKTEPGVTETPEDSLPSVSVVDETNARAEEQQPPISVPAPAEENQEPILLSDDMVYLGSFSGSMVFMSPGSVQDNALARRPVVITVAGEEIAYPTRDYTLFKIMVYSKNTWSGLLEAYRSKLVSHTDVAAIAEKANAYISLLYPNFKYEKATLTEAESQELARLYAEMGKTEDDLWYALAAESEREFGVRRGVLDNFLHTFPDHGRIGISKEFSEVACYGYYDGGFILYRNHLGDGYMAELAGGPHLIQIGSESFYSGNHFRLRYLTNEGEMPLQDAWREGLISDETLKIVAEKHDAWSRVVYPEQVVNEKTMVSVYTAAVMETSFIRVTLTQDESLTFRQYSRDDFPGIELKGIREADPVETLLAKVKLGLISPDIFAQKTGLDPVLYEASVDSNVYRRVLLLQLPTPYAPEKVLAAIEILKALPIVEKAEAEWSWHPGLDASDDPDMNWLGTGALPRAEFSEDRVIVSLTREQSALLKTYTPEDFPGLNIREVVDLTAMNVLIAKVSRGLVSQEEFVRLGGTEEAFENALKEPYELAAQILVLELEEEYVGKPYVLKTIEALMTLPYIKAAIPNWIGSAQ